MTTNESQGFHVLFKIASPYLVVVLLYSSLVFGLEEWLGDHIYGIPPHIGSIFGLAIAFFLGFRMNSAYDRWWEARKVLGELTNTCRALTAKVATYIPNSDTVLDGSFVTQLRSYLSALEIELCGVTPIKEKTSLDKLSALTKQLHLCLGKDAVAERIDMMGLVNDLYHVQGKAERIQNTPFLMVYQALTRVILWFYVLLIPFFVGDIDLGGEGSYFECLAIPILIIVGSVFLTINRLANDYAQPFSRRKTSHPVEAIFARIRNDINLTAHCRRDFQPFVDSNSSLPKDQVS